MIEQLSNPTLKEAVRSKYLIISNWLRSRGKLYGNSDKLATALAKKYGLGAEEFIEYIRRAKCKHVSHREVKGVVDYFQEWCARNAEVSTDNQTRRLRGAVGRMAG